MNNSSILRLFVRSCVENSPRPVEVKPFALTGQATSHGRTHTQLHQLKRKLLREALEETPDLALYKRLCGAANQAADAAWVTDHPLLVFPCLFEEMVHNVRARFGREAYSSPKWLPATGKGSEPDADYALPVAAAWGLPLSSQAA